VTQQSVTFSTNQCNFDNSLSVLQATADVTDVDRPLQFVANTQSDVFFGDVYRSAQDDVLTDVIGRGWADILCVAMTWSLWLNSIFLLSFCMSTYLAT
jgi:hypothetical protein